MGRKTHDSIADEMGERYGEIEYRDGKVLNHGIWFRR